MSVPAIGGSRASDSGKAIGMTVIYAGLDLEQAADELASANFEAAEVFVGHLGPRVVPLRFSKRMPRLPEVSAPTGPGVSTLNCIAGYFDPFSSDRSLDETAEGLARHMRLGPPSAHRVCSSGTVSWIG